MKNARKGMHRRGFLAGLGLAGLGSLLGRAPAHAAGSPKRVIFFYTPNGTVPTAWRPEGATPSFNLTQTLSPILQPLAPHRKKLIVLGGVKAESALHGGNGNGHHRGIAHMLTCTEMVPGSFVDANGELYGYAGGPSIDQVIAAAVGTEMRFPSLELGVRADGGSSLSYISYSGAASPNLPENNPRQVWSRVFGELTLEPDTLAKLYAERRSVLDINQAEIESVLPKLGAEHRQRLEQHMEAMREVELQLNEPATSSCEIPVQPAQLSANAIQNFPTLGKMQMDLLVRSFACDQTRVATLMWSRGVGNLAMSFIDGVNEGHHDLSHRGDSDAAAQSQLTKINNWYAKQLAYLIEQLKAVPEGDGTLFDSTLILWTSDLGKGNNHSFNDMPYVLAGDLGGSLSSGRFIQTTGKTHSDLMTSIAQAMGLPLESFGNPSYNTSPIDLS